MPFCCKMSSCSRNAETAAEQMIIGICSVGGYILSFCNKMKTEHDIQNDEIRSNGLDVPDVLESVPGGGNHKPILFEERPEQVEDGFIIFNHKDMSSHNTSFPEQTLLLS